MPIYFEYALKVSVCLAITFIFYALLLKRITYYTCNRYFLLILSFLSFIFPLINVSAFMPSEQIDHIPFVNQLPSLNNNITSHFIANSDKVDYWKMVTIVYLLVCSILSLRLGVQLLSLRNIRKKSVLKVNGAIKIYHIEGPVLPFSFRNNIFINYDNYNENELNEIIEHECVHVQQKHTVDVLISEIICIVSWYNPFAWLIKKAVRENLEFIADDVLLNKGIDRKDYQYLLLKVTGYTPSSITNNFTFSSIKSRIVMMNRSKTNNFHLLKFALLIPIAAIILIAFRNKNENGYTNKNTITKTYTLSSLTYAIPDKKVEAVVKKEQNKSLLKTGEALNLDLVFNEKARLKDLLESTGFSNIDSHAITFMIDTAAGNNSFSVQININVTKGEVSKNKDAVTQTTAKMSILNAPGKLEAATQLVRVQNVSFQGNVSRNEGRLSNSTVDHSLLTTK